MMAMTYFCFFGHDSVDCKPSLDVIEESEILSSFIDCHYI